MRRLLLAPLALAALLAPAAQAEAGRVVSILADTDKPPYAYVQDGEFRGVSIELLRAVFENTRYELALTAPTSAQKDALHKQGELGGAGFYPARSETGSFVRSDPLFTLKHCLYTRRGYPKVSVANAAQFRVGVRDEPYLGMLARSHLGVSGYVPYKTPQEGVELLLSEEVDVLFDDEAVVGYAFDALGKAESVALQQRDLFAVPVSIALPDSMADIMDELNVRISEVRSSGLASRLLNDSPPQLFALDWQSGNVVVPFAAVGVATLLLVAAIVWARSSARTRERELEALCDSFPAMVLGGSGRVLFVNSPMKELFSFLKLQSGKRFPQNIRFENVDTGMGMVLPPGSPVDDALLLDADTVLWRGSLNVSPVKYRVDARAEQCWHIAFGTLREPAQKRSSLLRSALMGAPPSLNAYCESVFELLSPMLLATAMAVYVLDENEGCKAIFETIDSDATLKSMCAKLYGAIEAAADVRVLSPSGLTELAARCGVRYAENVRFIVAPVVADSEMIAMLWLRTRVTRWEVSASETDAVSSAAWRLGRALEQLRQDENLVRSGWFDSLTSLPNSAYFDVLLEHLGGEAKSVPAFLQPELKQMPSSAAAALLKIEPCGDETMAAAAKALGGFSRFTARLSRDMFGLLEQETDVSRLRELIAAAAAKAREAGAVSVRAGAARYPFDSLSGQGVLSRAHAALNEAENGKIIIFGEKEN